MIDWSELREMMWDARWDTIVMFAKAVWQTSLDNPWMFAVWGLVLLTLTRRGWMKLLSYIGRTFVRSQIR